MPLAKIYSRDEKNADCYEKENDEKPPPRPPARSPTRPRATGFHEGPVRKAYKDEIHTRARSLLHSGRVTTWTEALAQADDLVRCGAWARSSGKPCRSRPVPGRKRCRLHGGLPHTEEVLAMLRVKAAVQPRVRGRWAKIEAVE
jgi:hypothetical protein